MATRAENAAAVKRLRDEGLLQREITERLGLSRSYVSELLVDPEGTAVRERKARYHGTCVDCGGATYGGAGLAAAPKRCHPCRKEFEQTPEYRAAKTLWSRPRIIAAIQDWAAIHGEPPAVCDWNPHHARILGDEERAQRYEREADRWPGFTSVFRRFGSWTAALEAAGFEGRSAHGGDGNQLRRRHRTHCHRGHEWTPENTYKIGDRRWCRTCVRLRAQRYRDRRKESVAA